MSKCEKFMITVLYLQSVTFINATNVTLFYLHFYESVADVCLGELSVWDMAKRLKMGQSIVLVCWPCLADCWHIHHSA